MWLTTVPTKRPLLSRINTQKRPSGFRTTRTTPDCTAQLRICAPIQENWIAFLGALFRCLTLLTCLEHEHPLNGIDVDEKHQRLGIPNSFMATAMASRAAEERTSSSKMFQTSDGVILGCVASGAHLSSLHIIQVHSILYIYRILLIFTVCFSADGPTDLLLCMSNAVLILHLNCTESSNFTDANGFEQNTVSIPSSPFTCMILDCPWFLQTMNHSTSLGPGMLNTLLNTLLNASLVLLVVALLSSSKRHQSTIFLWAPSQRPCGHGPVQWASQGTWSSEGKHTSTQNKHQNDLLSIDIFYLYDSIWLFVSDCLHLHLEGRWELTMLSQCFAQTPDSFDILPSQCLSNKTFECQTNLPMPILCPYVHSCFAFLYISFRLSITSWHSRLIWTLLSCQVPAPSTTATHATDPLAEV